METGGLMTIKMRGHAYRHQDLVCCVPQAQYCKRSRLVRGSEIHLSFNRCLALSPTHQHDHAVGGNIIGQRFGQTGKLAIRPNIVRRG